MEANPKNDQANEVLERSFAPKFQELVSFVVSTIDSDSPLFGESHFAHNLKGEHVAMDMDRIRPVEERLQAVFDAMDRLFELCSTPEERAAGVRSIKETFDNILPYSEIEKRKLNLPFLLHSEDKFLLEYLKSRLITNGLVSKRTINSEVAQIQGEGAVKSAKVLS